MYEEGTNRYYFYDNVANSAEWDTTDYTGFRKHTRITSCGDEGPDEFTLFQYLASRSCSILFFRDPSHKLHRHMERVYRNSPSPLVRRIYGRVYVTLKATRGPWKQGRFGSSLKEAFERYLSTDRSDCHLLAMLTSNILRDKSSDEQLPPGLFFSCLRVKGLGLRV